MHLNFLKRFYPDFAGKKILDLGCGRGDFLLECYEQGLDVVGIDINPEYIKINEEKIKNNGFESRIIQGEGEKLPFENDCFDFINCTQVLEHTNNPEKVLEECFRVLKPGGRMFATVHNKFGFKDAHYKLIFLNWLPRFLKDKYIKLMGKSKEKYKFLDTQKINEMHYFTYRNFQKLVQKIGFKIKDTRLIQLDNPEIIVNKLIKKFLLWFKKFKIINLIKIIYYPARLLYCNTFHIILKK